MGLHKRKLAAYVCSTLPAVLTTVLSPPLTGVCAAAFNALRGAVVEALREDLAMRDLSLDLVPLGVDARRDQVVVAVLCTSIGTSSLIWITPLKPCQLSFLCHVLGIDGDPSRH
jgi:hypothetical protein